MTIYAAIDIGTNSLKMQVAEVRDQSIAVIDDVTEVTRLGEGIRRTHELSAEAIERTANAVATCFARAVELGAQDVVAAGTMAVRSASNAGDLISAVRDRCGLQAEVLDGVEELLLVYRAVRSGLDVPCGRSMIFDIGGGSTEFITVDPKQIRSGFSYSVGARLLTEEFCQSDPVTDREFAGLIARLEEALDTLDIVPTSGFAIGVGGAVTTLASVDRAMVAYDAEAIHGSRLTLPAVERQVAQYRVQTIAERRATVGLLPDRADVILAGATIVMMVMRRMKVQLLTISSRGLCYGLLLTRFGSGRDTRRPR